MGNQRNYLAEGGFAQWLYRSHPDFDVIEINGVRGKAVYHIDDPKGGHIDLPTYANTSDLYFRVEEGKVAQGKLYTDRRMVLDFDWDHSHTNTKTGETFPIGTVHVQQYMVDDKGRFKRLSGKARLMTIEEIKKYGPIIRAFNPNVKFR